MHKKSSKNRLVPRLEWRSKIYSESQDVNNVSNEHFTKVAESLLEKLKPASCDIMSFVKKRIANSMLLAKTDMYKVIQLINSNDINKATGPDGISAKVFKISKEAIAPYLSSICNHLLEVGKYPKGLNIAKIIPVFKSGQKTNASNYRAISILNQLNKIVEKILH